ncbi:hypothetical protein [uncultured Paracoccus sp.]|uniref:hypothetical protein n=1 Tax=uncultured Paracoccus sp. TaxID=189685 RepID=UPI002604B482|nr:hypothetical protein [uncultured Paracoccus sp.]
MIDRRTATCKAGMRGLLLGLLLSVGSGPAVAGPLSDLIMAPGLLADLPAGDALRYRHERTVPQPDGTALPGAGRGLPVPSAVNDAELKLAPDGAGMLVLSSEEPGESQPMASFPAAGGNPVLLFFLENVVRNLAVATGGSPFYLRNRMLETLVAADLLAAAGGPTEILIHPFAQDPNRARLGPFADLQIGLRLDPGDPARLLALSADAGTTGYRETMTLVSED